MKSQGNNRIRFSLEKLKDPNIADIFRATIGGKFAPLLVLGNQDTGIDSLINRCNTTVTETANDILGKHRPTKKPWVADDILKLCDKRRDDDDNDSDDNDYDGVDNEEEEEEEKEDNGNDDNNHGLM